MKSLTRNHVIMKTQVSNTTFFLLPLFAILFLITSCGSFSPVGYYNDGIYGDTPPPKKQYTNNTDGNYYKKYFGDKAKELADNNRDEEIDSLSTPTQSNRDIDNININVYGYGSHGLYHNYSYHWNDYYYRPWWRHYRYRPWHSWSYYYEPYYYGWSHNSPYYAYYPYSYYGYNPYYHYYGSSYYTNPNQYVASSGRRGAPARGTSNTRSNSTNSLSGDSYQIQRRGGVIVTALGDKHDFVSRFFTPQATILEDPVTGSAHCTLVPYWAKRLNKPTLHARQCSARGGELWCEDQGERVQMSGLAQTFSAGTFSIADSL